MSSSNRVSSAQVINGEADLHAFALSIADQVQAILTKLEERNLPQPALGANAPSPDFIPPEDVELKTLKRSVVENARLLADVFTGPRDLLLEHCVFPNHNAWTMQALYAYDVPNHVPLEGSISFAELSKACGMEEDKLIRILRYSMLNHVFSELEPGRVSHSATSKLLATEQMSMDFLGHSMEDIFPACFGQVSAMKAPQHPREASILDCGLSLHFSNSQKAGFEIMGEDPKRVKRFAGAMEFMSAKGSIAGVSELLGGFEWRSLGDIKVVDVGGSSGGTARPLLRYADNIVKVIVQDLPDVVEAAKAETQPEDIADRLEFEEGNFFEPQRITDADVYLLRQILHDWPTDKCMEILRNLVPSVKSGARVVVNNALVPDTADERQGAKLARVADLQMMIAFNARERTLGEWKAMVSEASDGEMEFESVGGNVLVFRKK